MDKAKKLAQIMFEEDTVRIKEGRELLYFTKEDYEEEKKEREKKKRKNK